MNVNKMSAREQYDKMKEKHPEAITLFLKGDFYEAYEDDASVCSGILGISETKQDEGMKVARFVFHALDKNLPMLVRAGKRVVICGLFDIQKV